MELLHISPVTQARNIGTLLLKGIAKEGLYQIQGVSSFPPQVPTALCCPTISHTLLSMFATLFASSQSNSSQFFAKTLSGINKADCSLVILAANCFLAAMSVSVKSVDVNFSL